MDKKTKPESDPKTMAEHQALRNTWQPGEVKILGYYKGKLIPRSEIPKGEGDYD